MAAITIDQIAESLRGLPAEKLAVVYDFVSYLAERENPIALDADGDPVVVRSPVNERKIPRRLRYNLRIS
jgi:hypothetical protein